MFVDNSVSTIYPQFVDFHHNYSIDKNRLFKYNSSVLHCIFLKEQ